jgi:hypothetical protein
LEKNPDPDLGTGIKIPDIYFSESSVTVFGLKILKIFRRGSGSGIRNFFVPDQGSGMEIFRSGIRDGNIQIRDPG